MQVQRQLLNVTSRRLVIDLPESFVNHRVELIALTLDEDNQVLAPEFRRQNSDSAGQGKILGDTVELDFEELREDVRRLVSNSEPVELGEFSLDLTGFKFDREEANAR